MSEHQVILLLTRIEEMLRLLILPKKDVFTSREAAIYLGVSERYVIKLARKNKFPSFRPNNGKRYYKRRDLYNWLLSMGNGNSSPISEAEKMAILNPERG